MTTEVLAIKNALKEFNFKHLFIEELLWDRYQTRTESITVDDETFDISSIAEKKGMVVLECKSQNGKIPKKSLRDKVERQVAKTNPREHLIVFTDAKKTEQLWQWVDRDGRRKVNDHRYHIWQSGDSLVQKLRSISIELSESESITLPVVVSRARQALRKDHVTKKFFDKFQQHHEFFLEFIQGIDSFSDKQWYASLMLNRLMFVYFIQKQGFLDGNVDYLRDRLNRLQSATGPDKFHSFYKHFLLRLFHEGLGKESKARPTDLDKLLGQVPYLNGGLFDEHKLETEYQIEIPDKAFEQIFEFFDKWDWHLDDRPLKDDKEINPDVLGYIFEKYINVVSTPVGTTKQKEMGAYYTKEDVTEYIAKNTIIPFVFGRILAIHKGEHERILDILKAEPDNYLYQELTKGLELPLPSAIQSLLRDPIKNSTGLNKPADEEFAERLESWRDVINRRQQHAELKGKISSVSSLEELVTLNIDIWHLAEDAIRLCDDPVVLLAYYQTISGLSILDPTCGSGAFLFAALNILKSLYDACLSRMEFLLAQSEKPSCKEYEKFSAILTSVNQHPNREFFILKSITLGNLYGVDIMEEAVEICKLRLFLKLISQVDKFEQIEALPDIDFNIRAGNTLVGFSNADTVRESISKSDEVKGKKKSKPVQPTHQLKLPPTDSVDTYKRINEAGFAADRAFEKFRFVQTEKNVPRQEYVAAKKSLVEQLDGLDAELNKYLATDYGVSPDQETEYARWCNDCQPLHWHVDFYGIMHRNGGFDVIIGNPPYVVYKPADLPYPIKNFTTLPSGDLYAFVMERSYQLLRDGGKIGMIVPISSFGTDGFETLQKLTLKTLETMWVSCYSNRPSQIFDGAQKRLTIILGTKKTDVTKTCKIRTSAYFRWKKEEREALLTARLRYGIPEKTFAVFPGSLEKIGSDIEASIFKKLMNSGKELSKSLAKASEHKLFYTRKFGYFLAFLDRPPVQTEIKSGKTTMPSELKFLQFKSKPAKYRAIAALSSSTFFWFWNVVSDCRNLNKADLLSFPLSVEDVPKELKTELELLGKEYLDTLYPTSYPMEKSGKYTESFKYSLCKPIFDKIDRAIGKQLGFSEAEIEFIINYDIKYRVGVDAGSDDLEEE